MLPRTDVLPFLRLGAGGIQVDHLPANPGAVAFADRILRLTQRLEGRSRHVVTEGLRRQERRVRDVRRLAGISRTLLDLCDFRPPARHDRAPEVRRALFLAGGRGWPPLPADARRPYREAARELGVAEREVDRLLYADRADRRLLRRVPEMDGEALLARYNLDLARAVLGEAREMTIRAEGGWRDILRAVKLARLMYRLAREGEGYRLHVTGPCTPFVTRPQRYGARFARLVPAVARAPGWSIAAAVLWEGGWHPYRLDASSLPAPPPPDPGRYDSAWERDLAGEFAEKIGGEREGWTLLREATPIPIGEEILLPDFTARHADGREALIEVVGFWTPEYLEEKVRKVARAGLDNLVLVVYRDLAAGALEEAASGPVLRFAAKPRIAAVMEAVERVARPPAP